MTPRTRNAFTASLLLLLCGLAAAYDVGAQVAPWEAQDAAGQTHRLADLTGKVVVLVWWAPNCPASKAYAERLEQLKSSFAGKPVVFLAVASATGMTAARAQEGQRAQGLTWPILLDPALSLASAFGARMTTEVQVIDAQGVLRYKGQIDDDPRGQQPTRQSYLQQAVSALLAGGEPPPATPTPRASRIQ